MQACIGIRQSPQQEIEAYLGPVYLETMMMLHLNGHWSGSLHREFLQLTALQPELLMKEKKNVASKELDDWS